MMLVEGKRRTLRLAVGSVLGISTVGLAIAFRSPPIAVISVLVLADVVTLSVPKSLTAGWVARAARYFIVLAAIAVLAISAGSWIVGAVLLLLGAIVSPVAAEMQERRKRARSDRE